VTQQGSQCLLSYRRRFYYPVNNSPKLDRNQNFYRIQPIHALIRPASELLEQFRYLPERFLIPEGVGGTYTPLTDYEF